MSETKRKNSSGEFKAKAALEAARSFKTVNEIGHGPLCSKGRVSSQDGKRGTLGAALVTVVEPLPQIGRWGRPPIGLERMLRMHE